MASALLGVADSIQLGTTSIPLIGAANIWIEDSLVDDSSIKLAQSIIQKSLELTAPGQLDVIVYDDGLSGLASPFWPLNSGGEKILQLLNDEGDFKATLQYLRDHVQGVKNVMQGLYPGLVSFRDHVDYPVEGYKLVIISTDFSTLDEVSQTQMAILLKAAPAAGVSFLVHSMTLGANPLMVAMCDYLTVRGDSIEREDEDRIYGWIPPTAETLIETSQRTANHLASAEMDTIAFTDVQSTNDLWHATSKDGISFALGKYGLQNVEVTLGDELNQRHNALITGAVGQGKSNLISVIIHSICQRYAPTEVEFYLLDFKEGVTLRAFFDADTGEYLPHARVLGLEADREFGLSVFKNLLSIYKSRMKTFKAVGVQNVKQYRDAFPDGVMPRIVVVIDEFQMMFADRDRISDEIADLLVKGVRLFRACGIHIILASQTIGGNMSLMGSAGEGLFGQVPVRIALKNSLNESHATLGDKNEAAVHLRAREAIINEDYGDITANKKTSIAFADENVLAPLRRTWWNTARATARAPYVFVGDERRSLADDAGYLTSLEPTRWLVLLGSRIEVDSRPLSVPLDRNIGRNIVILGSGDAVAEIENMVQSLAVQRSGTRFVVLDCLDQEPIWETTRDAFLSNITALGGRVESVSNADVPSFVTELYDGLSTEPGGEATVIIGLGIERCRAMPMEFQELIKAGPPAGVHVIGWWRKLDSFREHVGYGGESFFDTRMTLHTDVQSAKDLMSDPLLEWRPSDNRMLAWDTAELPQAIRVIPYSVFRPISADDHGGG